LGNLIMETVKHIRLSKSCIGSAERSAVEEVLKTEFLGMGEVVKSFEEDLSQYFGRSSLCVANGTAALQLALQACGIGPGDEVLVPSLTYLASFQAISAIGALPIACDIDEFSLCIDPVDAESLITNKTRAIMPVHYGGGVGNLDKIYDLAKRHGIRVVEDAAHAFGSSYQDRRVGSFGDIVCFSFDGIKNITSGEGGCIVTADKKIIRFVSDARLLGVERDTEARYKGGRSWDFDVCAQGWRYHMSNIMAAIGKVQLKQFPAAAAKRCALAQRYTKKFSTIDTIEPILTNFETIVPHIYVLRIDKLTDRDGLRKKLRQLGIETGVHYLPNHYLSYYKDSSVKGLPITERIYPELLTLPLHPDLSTEDIDYVAETLVQLLSEH
jgi:dTDP-4-amino-4,6-dideoxygalactose transaminase